MQLDRYTKALLAIIAILLTVNIFASYRYARVAHAQSDMVKLVPIPGSAYANGGSIPLKGTVLGTVCPPYLRSTHYEPLQQRPAEPGDQTKACFVLVRE